MTPRSKNLFSIASGWRASAEENVRLGAVLKTVKDGRLQQPILHRLTAARNAVVRQGLAETLSLWVGRSPFRSARGHCSQALADGAEGRRVFEKKAR
jgi:hypothetical protein